VTEALHVRGVLLPDDVARDLWLVGDRVTFSPVPGAVTVADRGFILPGLVDAHCHIGITLGGPPATMSEAREAAIVDRSAGVLAIRDAGSPLPYGPAFDDDDDFPRLARAGRHIAAPRRYLRDIGVEVTGTELIEEVQRQAAGSGWVKLVGDWIDRAVGDLAPSWDTSLLASAVSAAHEAGARVAGHVFAEESVAALVRAGIDSVEHGTGLSDDDISLMAAQGTALVPTLLNVRTFDRIAAQAEPKFPRYAAHMRALRERFPGVVRKAHEAGVPIYVGTDAGGTIEHGLAAREMLLLAEAGLSNEEVLRAGSWGAREWLGFPGLIEGGLADLVVYEEDPREDLRALLKPSILILRGRALAPGGGKARQNG
jgi:imidazolonepropionase-like amidohydrolase